MSKLDYGLSNSHINFKWMILQKLIWTLF